jgi:hypothetical protein
VPQVLLGFFGGVAKYADSLFNWPPQPQSDQGELFWVGLTLAFSMGVMVMLGQWWSR